jgi:hypothetical protein
VGELKHGTYSLQEQGPKTEAQLLRHAELKQQYSTREGRIEAMAEQAAMLTQLREVSIAWIVSEIQSGHPLEEIKLLERAISFANSERLALMALDQMSREQRGGKHGAKRVLDAYEPRD